MKAFTNILVALAGGLNWVEFVFFLSSSQQVIIRLDHYCMLRHRYMWFYVVKLNNNNKQPPREKKRARHNDLLQSTLMPLCVYWFEFQFFLKLVAFFSSNSQFDYYCNLISVFKLCLFVTAQCTRHVHICLALYCALCEPHGSSG